MNSCRIGIWANENAEYARTKEFSLLFLRRKNQVFSILSHVDSSVTNVGMAIYDIENKICSAKVLDYKTGKALFELGDALVIKLGAIIIENFISDEELILSLDGCDAEKLDFVERINISDPYEMPTANKDNVAECLTYWGLGTSISHDKNLWSFNIETCSHSYTFTLGMLDGGSICYGRAARVRYYKEGTVFAQNIRLMSKQNEFTVKMPLNNLEVAAAKVVADETFFNSHVCTTKSENIYWSLKSVSPEEILLNGCGGQTYVISRPHVDSKEIVEWFKL